MQARKFERAQAAFEKVLNGPSNELADRVKLHLSAIQQALARTSTSFKTPEEHYDYAISLMNAGDYDGTRQHLERLGKQYPKADYVWYGLAALAALSGQAEESIRTLDTAIRLNAANRIHARNDSDFQNLLDDPRFTELLYPEAGSEPPPPPSPPARSRRRK